MFQLNYSNTWYHSKTLIWVELHVHLRSQVRIMFMTQVQAQIRLIPYVIDTYYRKVNNSQRKDLAPLYTASQTRVTGGLKQATSRSDQRSLECRGRQKRTRPSVWSKGVTLREARPDSHSLFESLSTSFLLPLIPMWATTGDPTAIMASFPPTLLLPCRPSSAASITLSLSLSLGLIFSFSALSFCQDLSSREERE